MLKLAPPLMQIDKLVVHFNDKWVGIAKYQNKKKKKRNLKNIVYDRNYKNVNAWAAVMRYKLDLHYKLKFNFNVISFLTHTSS